MTDPIRTVEIFANRPAHYRKAVVFCCDQGFLPYATHATSQIAALHPDRDFDICICNTQTALSVPKSLDPLDLRVVHINTGDLFATLKLEPGKSDIYYLRLALPLAFAGAYDRILYLDSDIFVQGGDFSALLDVPLGPHPVAAVRDNAQWRTPKRRPAKYKRLGLPTSRYFNAGVMVLDVEQCNEQKLLQRCVELEAAHRDTLTLHDQDLYNAVLQGGWAELSPVWNWQFTWASRLFAAMAEPNIVHFIGPVKPWKDSKGELTPRYGRAMHAFTQAHFPMFEWQLADPPRLAADSAQMRNILLKHLVSGPKTARYLSRFPNDMVVDL